LGARRLQGERSFHIFYQLLRGATPQERAAWKLPACLEEFKYLNGKGAVTSIDGIDDASDFRAVRAAMTAVNISEVLQHSMFSIVSAVLWLGNVSFTAKNDDEVHVNKDKAFATACTLLEVPEDKLEFALTHRLMLVGHETYERPLNLGNALDTRDALAKVLPPPAPPSIFLTHSFIPFQVVAPFLASISIADQ
jgi:myosin V